MSKFRHVLSYMDLDFCQVEIPAIEKHSVAFFEVTQDTM